MFLIKSTLFDKEFHRMGIELLQRGRPVVW